MQLSVIIVNYNVHYFLEQALLSVIRAGKNLTIEIIVVDNNSSDQSVEMVRTKFPEVKLIANTTNSGFSVANNQGIEIAKGKYVLLLNPDTVVQEDTFEKCVQYMDGHPNVGGLGVKMIDGKGTFLPESKRSLPTPEVAFYKTFGLSSLFPMSKRFGRYHLAYLDKDQNHKIEVLSGAFMFMPKKVLNEIGGLDETFFMYGEDIDLSYRIIKAGYENHYLADTKIIHYKGESTKKGSLNYVKVFYEAMLIFAKKHFSAKQAGIYSIAIYFAIFIKGSLTFLTGIAKRLFLPLLDLFLTFVGVFMIADVWATKVRPDIYEYPVEFVFGVLPVYSLLWILSSFFAGTYEKPFKVKSVFKGIAWGTLIIAAIYGFLPEEFRFSRAIILLGSTWAAIALLLNRLLHHAIVNKKFAFELNTNRNIIIVGNNQEAERALNLLSQTTDQSNFVGFVSYDEDNKSTNYLGEFSHLDTIVDLYNIHEIIFCAEHVPTTSVIEKMTLLGTKLSYKILPSKSSSIIGSNSKNSAGDLYAIDVHLKLSAKRSKISKRLFDLVSSILLFLTLPITIWFVQQKGSYLSNLIAVFVAKKTWVGYAPNQDVSKYQLPQLKPGIIYPSTQTYKQEKGLTGNRLNLLYARDYSMELDFKYLLSNFSRLGS